MAGHFLHTKAARNFSLRDLNALDENGAHALFVRLRWGDDGKQACPECGVVDHHYVIRGRRQWRCKEKGCGRTFSVTSGTKFADRKLPFKLILQGLVIFVTEQKGISALAFSILLGVSSATGFAMLHKLRETLWQTRDLTPMKGVVHVDGSHFCGRLRDPNVHFGRSKNARAPKGRIEDATTFHPNRRIVMVVRELYAEKGKGACRTIVEMARGENAAVANELAKRYIVPGSIVMTDEGGAFKDYGRKYDHRTVNHKRVYRAKDGTTNNQAESFWARAKRMWRGQLHRMTPQYLAEYINECAWREDVRRTSQREKVEILLTKMLRSGRSLWWRGYWQGTHRLVDLEFTV